MSNNDVKIDHEAAKMVAERLSGDPAYRVMVKPAKLGTIARAYLDAMAQRDEATELLGKSINACTIARLEELKATIRAFLAKHRKTGA